MARAAVKRSPGGCALNRQLEDLALYPCWRGWRFLLARQDPSLSGPGITRAAIAGHLNTTPETISRVLVRLQDAGGHPLRPPHRILITDRDLLRSIAEL